MKTKYLKTLALSFIIGLVFVGFLHSQEITLVSQLDKIEQKALKAESQGNYKDTIKYFHDTARKSLQEYEILEGNNQQLMAAISEAYLHKLASLYHKNYQYKEAAEVLAKLDSDENPYNFKCWLYFYLANFYLNTNQLDKAKEYYARLGFISDWKIIGPFDNENGAGFNTPYPPESIIDFSATHEGKKIPVSWRTININKVSGGYVNLKGYLRPNDNSIAYAVTYVFLDKDRPVTIRLASEEGTKIWINKKIIHSIETQRQVCTLDQDIIPTFLSKGWNEIILKTSTTIGNWGFRLRITDTNGNLIKGLKYRTDNKQIKNLASPKTTSPSVNKDPLEYLEQTARRSPERPNYYFYVGLIRQARSNFDSHNPLDRKAFNNAALASFTSSYYYYYLAQSLKEKSVSYTEKEENQYRDTLETVTGLNADHMLALTDLAEYYLFSLNNLNKSSNYLKDALNINPEFTRAKYLEVKWLFQKGFDSEAFVNLKSLSQENPFYLPAQLEYARYLLNKNQLKKARIIYQNILRKINYIDPIARKNLINILIKENNFKEAMQLYEVMILLNPSQIQSYLARAKIMESQSDYESALKETNRALAICPQDYVALGLKGQYLHRLGKLDDAKQIWQQALRINPNYLWLQQYTDWIEDTNDSFETQFKVDTEKLIKEFFADNETVNPDFSAYYLVDQEVIKINKDGTCRKYIRQIAQILNEKGIRDFSTIPLYHNPEQQRLKVLTSRVNYTDGRKVDAMYKGNNRIEFPSLEIGAIVDLEYRLDDIQPGFFGDYFGDVFYFGTINPTYKSSYILISPLNKPLYFNLKNTQINRKNHQRR